MTEWAHLPNAAHIDRVLTHLTTHQDKWRAARGAANEAAWDAAWHAARDPARDAARDAAMGAAMGAARDACMALAAWDDCAYILDMPPDAVKLLANVGNNHAAVLLYPAVIAMQGADDECS